MLEGSLELNQAIQKNADTSSEECFKISEELDTAANALYVTKVITGIGGVSLSVAHLFKGALDQYYQRIPDMSSNINEAGIALGVTAAAYLALNYGSDKCRYFSEKVRSISLQKSSSDISNQ